MAGKATYLDLIAANKRNSVILVTVITALLAGLGIVFGELYFADWSAGLIIALVFAFFYALFAWAAGSGTLMAAAGAQEIEKNDAPQLFNVVEEMALAAGVPMPKIYIIQEDAPNAFATGASPDAASVAVTTGLLEKLNRDELQGVIAHEIAHIRNYDIRYMMLMAIMVGSVALLSDVFLRLAFFSGGRRRSKNDGNAQIVVMLIAIVLAILAPFFAVIIQLACSRQREYLADATAVEFTRNPDGLADALAVLAGDKAPMPSSKATEAMYIVSPKVALRGGADSLFSTHPPIEERIARLRALR